MLKFDESDKTVFVNAKDSIIKLNKLNYNIILNDLSLLFIKLYVKIQNTTDVNLTFFNIIELLYMITIYNITILYKNNKEYNNIHYKRIMACLTHL